MLASAEELLAKRESLRKSNFAIGQTKSTAPPVSMSQVQNSSIDQKWQKGSFIERNEIKKPSASSIKFGNGCQYESESKSNFTG
jgi:hypothetical protein